MGIREHTRVGEAAARWQAKIEASGTAYALLLRGDELVEAKLWVGRRRANAPEITTLLQSYLDASERYAASLADAERKRLDERERLIAETEVAQRRIRRVQRRSFVSLTGLLLLVLVGTATGLSAIFAGWRELMINRSHFIAGVTDREADAGRYVNAMLVDLDALPDKTNATARARMMPLEPSAWHALDGAWRKWSSLWGERRFLTGHEGYIAAVAFSPDGKRVLTGSWDKTARLWEAATGKPVATFTGHTGPIWAVAFSPDGQRVLTGSADNRARLWEVFSSAQALVEVVKASVPRCLTAAERERFSLGTGPPRWCYRQNLWPYADQAPAMSWDERLAALRIPCTVAR
jgi:hypothetical protein